MIWLGIGAHVNRDLAFMIEQSETVLATADLDIFAWRDLAWRNAEHRS